MPSAYLLVSHGSRDSRPQVAMERLSWLLSQSQTRTQTALQVATIAGFQKSKSEKNISNFPLVGTACLELAPVSLHEQIREFADRALKYGYNRIEIVPLFLLPGVHVMEDIPAEVAMAQKTLGSRLKLELKPHLGTHPGLIRLLANKQATTKAEVGILLAHGSRRAGAKQPVEAIAQQLGMLSAYWAVPPSLASRVQELVSAGHQQIGIVPYFLFAGGITDAIAQSVEQLQEQFPAVEIDLAEPLGASQELALLILDLVD
ncbi:MAG TPA: cobalamin biosynthesis protein CbiX [Cyanobacteria bacterium UBA11049]|nr:cobalamin biosynthesis protein CbiX [Cyanobacteria bacterium UBA11049]